MKRKTEILKLLQEKVEKKEDLSPVKEIIEKEGGIEKILGTRLFSIMEKLSKFRKENNLKSGELSAAVKYSKLYKLFEERD